MMGSGLFHEPSLENGRANILLFSVSEKIRMIYRRREGRNL